MQAEIDTGVIDDEVVGTDPLFIRLRKRTRVVPSSECARIPSSDTAKISTLRSRTMTLSVSSTRRSGFGQAYSRVAEVERSSVAAVRIAVGLRVRRTQPSTATFQRRTERRALPPNTMRAQRASSVILQNWDRAPLRASCVAEEKGL
jgi:hypothetical protein